MSDIQIRYGEPDRIGDEVKQLRICYKKMNSGGPTPNFDIAIVRDAYTVAYHPGHSYMYLEVLLNHGLGDSVIQVLSPNSTIGVLGAGAAAESLALCYFFEKKSISACKMKLSLVDQADWSLQRITSLRNQLLLLDGLSSSPNEIEYFVEDLLSQERSSFLSDFIAGKDIIICPAIFTELEATGKGHHLINVVHKYMKKNSAILLIDQSNICNFREKCLKLSLLQQFRCLHAGQLNRRIPSPPVGSFASTVLNGSDGRIPRCKYDFSWTLLQKT